MIYHKKGIRKRFTNFTPDNTIVVADFDATLTTSSCKSSWALLTESNLIPESLKAEIKTLNEKYAPYETDMLLLESVKENLTTEWSKAEFDILFKHKYNENYLVDAFNSPQTNITLRKGVKEFLSLLNKNNISLYIVSAGISNTIEMLLKKHQCLYPNITIISNKIIFENSIAKTLENSNIINLYNKNLIIEKRLLNKTNENTNVVLLGDVLSDANMCNKITYKDIIKIGFFEKKSNDLFSYYKNTYDFICTENSSILEIAKILFNKKNGIKFL